MSTQAPDKKKIPLKRRLLAIAPPILLLAGILVLLYPVFATQYNNYRQESIASQFSAVAEDAGPDAVAETCAAPTSTTPTLPSHRSSTPGWTRSALALRPTRNT